MSNHCCPETPADTETSWRCPRNGSLGKPVDRQTVEALLTENGLARLSPARYRFCPDSQCEVVYFGADSGCLTTEDVRVAVWQKQPFGDRQVCYCFGESESSIRAEILAQGRSSAIERLREHIAARRCACEVMNPRGSCCLGDVAAAIERVTQHLSRDPSAIRDPESTS